MIVSWNWLQDYVDLPADPAELARRLAMAGLNHEGSEKVGDDLAIDLEVTSNRPDCLGHLGVAREIGVLWDRPLRRPDAQPAEGSQRAADLVKVSITAPQMCRHYTARVIRGARVGPSPPWLVKRLATLGCGAINNVVDITNYVLFECGQPLHAFDLGQLAEPEIIVRAAADGEKLEAIDHKTYALDRSMCVIADPAQAVALAGIMGGASTEVSSWTTDLLIEAADFDPLTTRTTAHQLKLHSDSSYRFERGVDPDGVDWASRRCCELILELAGGQLAEGVVEAGHPPPARPPITLRLSQLPRVLGIDIPPDTVRRILAALGCQLGPDDPQKVVATPPSWRADCTREIDLVEEVARLHGYDKIPEDTSVPLTASSRSHFERVLDRVRQSLVGAGFLEAMTVSVVPADWNEAFNPWGSTTPVRSQPSMLKGADQLRQSVVPSLLQARKFNDAKGNSQADLFETSRVFVQQDDRHQEPWILALVAGSGYRFLKGVLEQLASRLGAELSIGEADVPALLAPGRAAQLLLNGQAWGWLGEVSDQGLKQFGLQREATAAEVNLDMLVEAARLVPQDEELSDFPSMDLDLNFIVPEQLRWSQLEEAVREAAGPLLERLTYQETYRDAKRDGPDRKRLLFTILLRSQTATLTSEQAEQVRLRIEQALAPLGGQIVG